MNQQTKNKYKQLLEKEKAELEEELKATPLVKDFGNDTEGEEYTEETDEAEEMANNAAIRAVLEKKLKAIKEALEKMK